MLRDISADAAEQLIRAYFRPYADGVRDLVAERLDACGTAVVVDIHSYPSRALPYELHADRRRPPLCIGADDFHTPQTLVDIAHRAWRPIGPAIVNEPFAGAYVPLTHYRRDPRVTAIMLEIRRDTYLDQDSPTRPTDLGPVIAALTAFLTELAAHLAEPHRQGAEPEPW